MYLMYHEELESLKTHLPEIRRIRFWMTFGDAYLKHLEVLQNVGMTRIDPVMYEGREIIPLQFLKAVLPEPASLGETTRRSEERRVGKSVSVRVDLGGGRIIKKKENGESNESERIKKQKQ